MSSFGFFGICAFNMKDYALIYIEKLKYCNANEKKLNIVFFSFIHLRYFGQKY